MSNLSKEESSLSKDTGSEKEKESRPVLVISPNSLNYYQNCELKYKYYKKDGLVPKKKSYALSQGTILHTMEEVFYKGLLEGKRDRGVLIDEAVMSGRHQALDHEIDIDEVARHFQEELQYHASDPWEILAVEQPFMKVLYQDSDFVVAIEAKLDLLIRTQGKKIVVDHKKVGRKQETSSLGNQFTCYAWITDTDTVYLNKIGFQKSKEPKDRFIRQVLQYSPEQIEEWERDTIQWALRIKQSIDTGVFLRDRTGCDMYSGCFYRGICEAKPGADRDFVIGRDFMLKEAHFLFPDEDEEG